jgi:hypothetical protein
MSLRARIVASAALATASFLLAPSALAASHPVQVTGVKLKSALLPTSAFGSDHQVVKRGNSGNRLLHAKARYHVPTLSCGKFENLAMASFGQTASAFNIVANQNPFADYPNTDLLYWQSVYQFSSAKAATTFFNQERTKYAKCTDFNVTVPADSIPGSGLMEVTNQSMAKAKVGKYQSFEVGQVGSFSEAGGITVQLNTTITVKGTDVFAIESWSGTNDQVSDSLMLKFINRVSKLR